MRFVDMHCDTISEILEQRRNGRQRTLRENKGQLDLQRMKSSGYLLQNFALFVDSRSSRNSWEEVCALYEIYREELEVNGDMLAPILKYEDIAANEASGKMSAMLTVEEGAVCGGRVEKLYRLYEMGVRMLTLTWNYPNELGYPNLNMSGNGSVTLFVPDTKRGLTEKGREFAVQMEKLGMIIDVSHLSDGGFYDVLDCTRKPFVASHSNARAICPCVRNLTDDMIRRLSDRGGCMGLNYCVDFLLDGRQTAVRENEQTVLPNDLQTAVGESSGAMSEEAIDRKGIRENILEAVARHAHHIVRTGGIEVLGLGSDFDGISTNEALPGVQSMELLWETLHKAGFTQGELDKIFYGNVLRVYKDILS